MVGGEGGITEIVRKKRFPWQFSPPTDAMGVDSGGRSPDRKVSNGMNQILRWLTHRHPHAGVYALVDGDRIMYVGESQNVPVRIRQHERDGKPFAEWKYMRRMQHSTARERREVESRLIRRHAPPWNGGGPYRPGPVWSSRRRLHDRYERTNRMLQLGCGLSLLFAVLVGAGSLAAFVVLLWVAGSYLARGWRRVRLISLGLPEKGPVRRRD